MISCDGMQNTEVMYNKYEGKQWNINGEVDSL